MTDTIILNTPDNKDRGDGMLMNVVLGIVFLAIAIGAVMVYQDISFQSDSQKLDATNIDVISPAPISAL